jgi:hypothetical protein
MHSLTPQRLLYCCSSPLLGPTGEKHSLAGERVVVGPNSDEGTDTLVLYVFQNTCTV